MTDQTIFWRARVFSGDIDTRDSSNQLIAYFDGDVAISELLPHGSTPARRIMEAALRTVRCFQMRDETSDSHTVTPLPSELTVAFDDGSTPIDLVAEFNVVVQGLVAHANVRIDGEPRSNVMVELRGGNSITELVYRLLLMVLAQ